MKRGTPMAYGPTRRLLWRCAAVGLVFIPIAAWAAPITAPPDLNPGDTYRIAFVTSTTRDATSTNIGDYNAFVTAAANSVPKLQALGTTWKAIGSTFVDARDNTGTNFNLGTGVPIYRLDGARIANNNADLWDGTLAAPLSIDESGNSRSVLVWTGTYWAGDAFFPGYLGDTGPNIGWSHLTNSNWIWGGVSTPNTTLRSVYGLSGELTLVPEPSSFALAALGMLGALAIVRRKSLRWSRARANQDCDVRR